MIPFTNLDEIMNRKKMSTQKIAVSFVLKSHIRYYIVLFRLVRQKSPQVSLRFFVILTQLIFLSILDSKYYKNFFKQVVFYETEIFMEQIRLHVKK